MIHIIIILEFPFFQCYKIFLSGGSPICSQAHKFLHSLCYLTLLHPQVMIEAVENHMPEVIIIDEIGTELEARAASTIAQRGVQLVGTAHGVTIESIVKNPCLQELVGGIEVQISL